MKKFDVVILGSGPASGEVAGVFSRLNKRVCIIEKNSNMFGGVCANKGCMPTKHLVKAAEIAEIAKKAHEFGIEIPEVKINMEQITKTKDMLLTQLNSINRKFNMAEIVIGHGRFISNDKVEVSIPDGSVEVVEAEQFVIATGARPKLIPGINIDGKYICTSNELLDNNDIPKKLLVVGGGVIGLEFASIYNSFGAEVTLIEGSERILINEDVDTSAMAEDLLKNKKIKIYANTKLNKAEIIDNKVNCSLDGSYINTELFDKILISIGRKPNIEDIGLENTDVKVKDGFIKVNDYLQTSAKNIYAVGDVIPTTMLAHTAMYESTIAAANMVKSESMKYTNKNTPRVIFSNPEIASVGLTESEAKEQYKQTKIINFPMMMNGKSIINHSIEGRVKIIYNPVDGVILGANIIGSGATELIHELTLAVTNKLTIDNLKNTVHAHPTLSEVLWFAASKGSI
ncbi:dihydrolipoyl dehydrogenase [Clostridium estertheticum]|uniref:Dihydrolipoyl dehydrogenase n=1 Tax=Clostridium estertheticum subsp. estertheticum TaxID=1552 RepID=A0A1J0GKC5_9CLOT|nr:dihydrolipoyl dehydrogenase [Clostridium estertheticum]APC41384.1 dihydrolipoyl dehydrogenase [Clostridium estertheticum subsp. estertheticum]MBZ9616726.1 dihydrolipoyl dehydrogenase [Clostridium estertheticum subsp. laramiense]WAG72438.1 dihydrolipoyl dehydrogenase [Clostridium estertheticum]